MIPFFDLKTQYNALEAELKAALDSVFESGVFILGKRLEEFESAFASYLGSRHVVGVGSGTDALILSLAATGVGRDDEVVTVANTAVPTVAAIRAIGAIPVFVDTDPDTLNMSPDALADILKRGIGRIKAVVPVHLYGNPVQMDRITEIAERHGLKIVEDACQAHGAIYKGKKTGTIGHTGCFSFYPTKNLGAYGDGGAIATDDPAIAEKLRLLRFYGQKDRYRSLVEGYNSRLDELQSAMLHVKLKYLDSWIERRRAIAFAYDRTLDPSRVKIPIETPDSRHSYHLYVIRHAKRDALQEYLRANGAQTLIHYPVPIHMQEAYAHLQIPQGSLPETEKAANEILSLPVYPELDIESARRIATLINEFER